MGIKLIILLSVFVAVFAYTLYLTAFAPLKTYSYKLTDRQFFGVGNVRDDDPKIMSFKISVSDVVLQDLKLRIETARIGHEQLEDVPDFEYGFNLATLSKWRDYWLKKYDWRKYEEILNGFPQFVTEIAGLKIHFLHVKPPQNKYKKILPLLLVHGWPGNVFEFYKFIPLLTDPNSLPEFSKNKVDFAFEVIAPSIPGYGWSEQPHKRGFSQVASARIFNTLMTERLGFSKYVAQGGDWGALNVVHLGRLFPEKLYGVHSNSAFVKPDSFRNILISLVAYIAPSLVYSNSLSKNFNFSGIFLDIIKESGYMHIQATKPDTVGVGLNDSPIGLLAYIAEKFSTWTNPQFKFEKDGGIEKKFTKDEILTIITIYWVNSNILSSQRYYREFFLDENNVNLENYYVTVPTGIAAFPYDLTSRPPIEFLSYRYNLTQYSLFEDGGHFAALEKPNELAVDVVNFVKKLKI